MPAQVSLTQDYGYSSYRYSGRDADLIDASEASWIVANTGSSINCYPFLVDNAKAGLDVIGGTILGKVSQTLDWTQAYVNSAAVMLRNTPSASVRDWIISQPWDGIRLAGGSGGFELDGIRVSNARDDAVENDDALSGTIRDSLFDGVFSGISLGNKNTPDRSSNVVTIDGVLLRMESYLYKGELTHGSPMKMEGASPALRITNSVFAIEDVDHIGDWRLDLAWDKTIESSGNTFLNLSDTPLPSDYPMPGKGWTVLQGQAARDHWKAARADWVAAHDDAPAGPGSGDGVDANTLMGTSGADTLTGSGANEHLYGLKGADTLTGGAGADVFVFNTAPGAGGGFDVVTDFDPRVDKVRLDAAVFTSLAAGAGSGTEPLGEAFFEVAARADDRNDHVMYKWRTGALYYDADGTGPSAMVQIAQLDPRLPLDHTDLLVV